MGITEIRNKGITVGQKGVVTEARSEDLRIPGIMEGKKGRTYKQTRAARKNGAKDVRVDEFTEQRTFEGSFKSLMSEDEKKDVQIH